MIDGYQPEKPLTQMNPPKGGSGVPNKKSEAELTYLLSETVKYVTHEINCAMRKSIDNECNCGLEELLTKLEIMF